MTDGHGVKKNRCVPKLLTELQTNQIKIFTNIAYQANFMFEASLDIADSSKVTVRVIGFSLTIYK